MNVELSEIQVAHFVTVAVERFCTECMYWDEDYGGGMNVSPSLTAKRLLEDYSAIVYLASYAPRRTSAQLRRAKRWRGVLPGGSGV